MKKLLPLLLLCCLAACGNSTQKAKESANEEEKPLLQQNEPVAGRFYPIKKFVDGDTFWIDDSTATGIKVRLIGMDTPESRNTRNKQKHPMGKEVADYVEQMLTGQRVRLELDVQHRDRYGRILAYVFLEDGTHLNAHLLEKGYALLMTVPPNVKYADTFYALQVKAREAGFGLWLE
jgi:micrococcal nuclease